MLYNVALSGLCSISFIFIALADIFIALTDYAG